MLRKLMNPGPTDPMTSFGLLLLRIAVGVMMIYGHGWGKLMAFSEKSSSFPDLLGIGGPANMALAIGAEVFAAALIVLGLFTRVVAIPLAITMIVAAFIVHADDPFAKKELALLYLSACLTLIFTGAGKFSVDGAVRG